ncbi:S-methyl-5'-thioinosine phosphorylase [Pseudomarimonas arenosa]|uniref:Probable S-methyl-5'-thioinosine phosphorylase n=1 Tax=Pseudomarimonas arenosa TaxID=2774145 RepID=A0AAW3ZF95_9GAMM|nr:S-methyl-5'-thioinosine phosphorylase [Pseudomarimonas arenosa]MBD8524823.1 S-methyl-5'-thioinosine phosphorylase [Pseudomarimonas arenosa]
MSAAVAGKAGSVDLAVIGGTGLYRMPGLGELEAVVVDTPYGATSAPIRRGEWHGRQIAFLARHGESHGVPPHKVNYRANLWALHQLGVQRVLALNTVGGITPAFGPQALGVPDQLIDYTWGRISTYCEEAGTPVQHIEFDQPYSASLRQCIIDAASATGIALERGGCLGVTQGPRLETRAEVARMLRDGCDLVGMTGMPEAALARELGLDYACLAIVANWAAGCDPAGESAVAITMDEVLANVAAVTDRLPALFAALLQS